MAHIQDKIEEQLKKNRITDIKPEEVKYIPMWTSGVSTPDKPVLLTIGIGSCRGVIVKTNNFAFLAHVDMGIGR